MKQKPPEGSRATREMPDSPTVGILRKRLDMKWKNNERGILYREAKELSVHTVAPDAG